MPGLFRLFLDNRFFYYLLFRPLNRAIRFDGHIFLRYAGTINLFVFAKGGKDNLFRYIYLFLKFSRHFDFLPNCPLRLRL